MSTYIVLEVMPGQIEVWLILACGMSLLEHAPELPARYIAIA